MAARPGGTGMVERWLQSGAVPVVLLPFVLLYLIAAAIVWIAA